MVGSLIYLVNLFSIYKPTYNQTYCVPHIQPVTGSRTLKAAAQSIWNNNNMDEIKT